MKRILKATALALGIILATATAAFACEQEPAPTPDQPQLVFIFCGKNAIEPGRTTVVFQGGPRGVIFRPEVSTDSFPFNVGAATRQNPVSIDLGRAHGRIDAYIVGYGEVVTRVC